MAEAEERTEQAIQVRQVTDAHSNWNEEERGEPGKFSIQLILDDGAEEYVLRATAQGTKVIVRFLGSSSSQYLVLERRALIANDISIAG